MKEILVLAMSLFWVVSCGAKSRVVAEVGNPSVTESQVAIPNVYASQSKTFYVHLDKLEFISGQVVTREIRLAWNDLSPVTSGVEFVYAMPEMPEMPVEPVAVEKVSPGLYRAKFDISMPGLWEFRVNVELPEGKKDFVLIRYSVPE